MFARNFCLSMISCAVCFLVAKLVAGYTLLPLDQQTQPVAKLEIQSASTSVSYCDSKDFTNADFKIRNRGNKRLTVNAKEFNCDCYAGGEGLVIPPGEEKVMSLRISMQALQYHPEVKFLLLTNDPAQPKVPLYIEVLNRPPLVPTGAVSVLQE